MGPKIGWAGPYHGPDIKEYQLFLFYGHRDTSLLFVKSEVCDFRKANKNERSVGYSNSRPEMICFVLSCSLFKTVLVCDYKLSDTT